MTRVMVEVPEVAFKGPHDTDAKFFRQVADRLEEGYGRDLSGGNVRDAVGRLLRAVADALEAATWTVVRDETVDAPLFYVVQCSVCPVRAAVATQPEKGWVCPRCAEVAEPVVRTYSRAPEICRAHWSSDCSKCDVNDDQQWVHPNDAEPVRVETGHDIGLTVACEMFPQHQKHPGGFGDIDIAAAEPDNDHYPITKVRG